MKDKLYKFITKANQVLLFVGALLLVGMVGMEIMKGWWHRNGTVHQVRVIDDNQSNDDELVVEYVKRHAAKIKDVHVIELRSYVIDAALKHEGAWKAKMFETKGNYYSSEPDDPDLVNVMFVDSAGRKRMLYEADKLITSVVYASFEEEYMRNRSGMNIYSVVSVDTNKNGFLDEGDSRDLYVSEYNGDGNRLVMDDIERYTLIDASFLLIEKERDKQQVFYEYEFKSRRLVELNTGIVTN